jgi:hypothetical protein
LKKSTQISFKTGKSLNFSVKKKRRIRFAVKSDIGNCDTAPSKNNLLDLPEYALELETPRLDSRSTTAPIYRYIYVGRIARKLRDLKQERYLCFMINKEADITCPFAQYSRDVRNAFDLGWRDWDIIEDLQKFNTNMVACDSQLFYLH